MRYTSYFKKYVRKFAETQVATLNDFCENFDVPIRFELKEIVDDE